MNEMQKALAQIFEASDKLTCLLKPYDGILKANQGRPLAECGLRDKVKIACEILKMQGLEVPRQPPQANS